MPNICFFLPTEIIFSPVLDSGRPRLSEKILVITSRSLPADSIRETINFFSKDDSKTDILLKESGEPESVLVENLLGQTNKNFAAVLAIGGGSVIDTAKAIALLKVSRGKITDYEFGERKIVGALPIYAAPTTCGSGSEVTPYCVITNSTTGRKFTITHDALRPTVAYINPGFLTNLPGQVILASALDAFVHNLEALLNKNTNPFIEPLATQGLNLIFQHLEAVFAGTADELAIRRLATASVYGGISITHSRTGLIHTLSVAFAEFAKEPHGLLNAKLLPHVLGFNSASYNGRLAEIISKSIGNNYPSDRDAIEFITKWVEKTINKPEIAGLQKITANKEHVVERVLQDTGLPTINAAPINRRALKQLIGEIVDEQAR